MNTYVAWFLILIASVTPASAGLVRGSWDEVRILDKGEQIRITGKDNKITTGTFQGLDKETLSFTEGNTERTLRKTDVRRVEVRTNGRMKNVLIGAGIGLGLGIAIDQTVGHYLRNEGGQSEGARAAVLVGLPAGIGGLSALIPSYKTVYRAPK